VTPKIDSHHHLWLYNAKEYDWIDEPMQAIRRDFLPPHLESEIRACGIDGTVVVQARQTLEETNWLLLLAARNDWMLGVVGWAPLTDPAVPDLLARLREGGKLKGVRHILQGEPDPEYMLREDFNRGIGALRQLGLVYDILIYERHLPQTVRFVDRHPDQVFVLDHIAKPRIREGALSPWREHIRELARRPNVYCKVSGMVTEADYRKWTEKQLRPYFDTVVECFGPARLMFGSDWPVCLVACDYGRWFGIVRRWIARLSAGEQARILGGTAVEAYKLAGKTDESALH
jgi:L-fuconolactonase